MLPYKKVFILDFVKKNIDTPETRMKVIHNAYPNLKDEKLRKIVTNLNIVIGIVIEKIIIM